MRLLAQVCPHFDPNAAWGGGEPQVIAKNPIFSLVESRRESPFSGAAGAFYRLECPEWVHAIPFTAEAAGLELLAVEQYRHGVVHASLEIPGGLCDPSETPLEAAKRELLEETGHASEHWTYLGFCTPNPAIQNNRCHFFLALECAPVTELKLDPTEELRVWAVPYREWESRMESGEVHHGLILAAFQRLRLSSAWTALEKRLPDPNGR